MSITGTLLTSFGLVFAKVVVVLAVSRFRLAESVTPVSERELYHLTSYLAIVFSKVACYLPYLN